MKIYPLSILAVYAIYAFFIYNNWYFVNTIDEIVNVLWIIIGLITIVAFFKVYHATKNQITTSRLRLYALPIICLLLFLIFKAFTMGVAWIDFGINGQF